METKTFKVIRASNGRGISNLLMVIEEGVPDIYIGTALIVPIAEGMNDPVAVTVVVNKEGMSLRTNFDTCIPTVYIH